MLRLLALSLLFLTAMLFLSRLCRYSKLNLSTAFFPLSLPSLRGEDLAELTAETGSGVVGGVGCPVGRLTEVCAQVSIWEGRDEDMSLSLQSDSCLMGALKALFPSAPSVFLYAV